MTEQDVLNRFLQFLERRELSICNYSKNGAGFWPIGDVQPLIERFLDEK
jgi:hypothetical protein